VGRAFYFSGGPFEKVVLERLHVDGLITD